MRLKTVKTDQASHFLDQIHLTDEIATAGGGHQHRPTIVVVTELTPQGGETALDHGILQIDRTVVGGQGSEQLVQGGAAEQQRLWLRCRGRANVTWACRSTEMLKDESNRPLGRQQGDFSGKPFFVAAAGFGTHTTATTAVAHRRGTEQC